MRTESDKQQNCSYVEKEVGGMKGKALGVSRVVLYGA